LLHPLLVVSLFVWTQTCGINCSILNANFQILLTSAFTLHNVVRVWLEWRELHAHRVLDFLFYFMSDHLTIYGLYLVSKGEGPSKLHGKFEPAKFGE